jgi:hypothetical protein
MIVTFQAQIDPINPDKKFTENELEAMNGEFMEFLSTLEKYKEYFRGETYVDGKKFNSRY